MNKANLFLALSIGFALGCVLPVAFENKEPLLYSSLDEEQQVVCYYTKTSLQCLPAVEADYD